jgi:hypothetical protein
MTEPTGQLTSFEVAETDERLKERLSTLIDTAGILAVAAGSSWGLFSVVGPYAVAIGGVIAIGLNTIAGFARRPIQLDRVDPVSALPAPAPGPTDPGNLHVSGR